LAAVAVDIPPNAFMEFQAYNVLVIADIRQLEHIEYTTARTLFTKVCWPCAYIANPEYAEYLRRFGEIGCKGFI
jgi:phenylalanine-4-hydroxylase